MGYHLNRLDELVFIAVSKPLLIEFDIHHRLESCVALLGIYRGGIVLSFSNSKNRTSELVSTHIIGQQLLHPNPDIPPPVDNRQIQHSGGADQTNQHWYNRAGTWNTSPSRRFLRNFPWTRKVPCPRKSVTNCETWSVLEIYLMKQSIVKKM